MRDAQSRQQEAARLRLEISEQQEVINQARAAISRARSEMAQARQLIADRRERLRQLAQPQRKKKRRSPLWDDDTPLIRLADPTQLDTLLTMIHDWEKHNNGIPIPVKTTTHIQLETTKSKRPFFIALARFLHSDAYPLRIPLMDFYRYLAAHTNLGNVATIKTGICRAREWIKD